MGLNPKTGCWIKYQLNLSNITYQTVGREANRSIQAVSDCIKGHRNSQAVETALCKLLGYENFGKLVAAMPQECGRLS